MIVVAVTHFRMIASAVDRCLQGARSCSEPRRSKHPAGFTMIAIRVTISYPVFNPSSIHSVGNDFDKPTIGSIIEMPSPFADGASPCPIEGGAKRRRFAGRRTSSGDLERRSRIG